MIEKIYSNTNEKKINKINNIFFLIIYNINMPFSLSNTQTVVADDIFLLENVDLKNIYDVFATISQLDAVTGFDQATIDILTNIANTMSGLPSTWYTDLVNSINLKRDINDSYSITYIDSNFYNKTTINNELALKANQSTTFTKTEVNNLFNNYYNTTYIDTLIADYYTKLQVDALIANSGGGGGGTVDQHTTKTAIVEFTNVDNIPNLDTLSIIGGDHINISDDSSNSLMDFSQYLIEVRKPFKCYSTALFIGNVTAPNIYNKTEANNLLDLKRNISDSYTKTEIDTSLATKANQSTTYTKTEVDTSLALKANQSTTYTKTEIDTSLALKANQSTTYTKTEVNGLFNNYYNSTYIDANFYDKTYIDNLPSGGGNEHQILKCEILEFKDFNNPGSVNTLSIIGGVNINITDGSSNSLMDFSQYLVEVHPPFKCYSTALFIGNLTAPNIYTKTNVDQLLLSKENVITGGASTITTTNLTANRVLISSNTGKVAVSTVSNTELDFLIGVTSGIQGQLNGKQATLTGGATSIVTNDLTANKALLSDSNGKVAVSTITNTELGYMSGVTSNIQTQLNTKQPTLTGGATSITTSDLTANKALLSDSSGKVAVSTVTNTELEYLQGVTSSIQTQLNTKQDAVTNITNTEISYLDGVTSNIQTQINNINTGSMPVFYYNIKFDYDGIAFNLMKDPKGNPTGADSEVAQSVYDQAQKIRDYVLSQYVNNGRYNVSMLELLYNNANRLVSNTNSNTLLTFLNTFNKTFINWLSRVIFLNTNVFGTANQTMVQTIQGDLNNNSLDRGLSIYKNVYYPFTNDIVLDIDGGNTGFTPPSSWTTNGNDPKVDALRLTETNGFNGITLTHVTNAGNMIEGYTTEFWFKQIQQTGSTNTFFGIGYWDGSSAQMGTLHVLSNGIQFTANSQTINVTSNNLKMFEFMFIAVWIQDSTWYLLVSQNGNNYISSGMTTPGDIKGIRDIYLLASTTNGVQFYIRDLFISNGREYNKSNISVNSNQFFNHACDTFTGVNIQFAPVTPTVLYSWTANTVYTFNGNQNPANNFNKSLTTVSGCRIPVSIPSTFTLEFEVDNLAPQNSLEFIFNVGTPTSRGVSLYKNANVHDLWANVSSTFPDSYSGFVTMKLVKDSTGIILYVNNVQKASHTNSNIGTLSDLYIGHYFPNQPSSYGFTGQMKNLTLSLKKIKKKYYYYIYMSS